ncbi:unnamed protein product (macronuclear) [Paramecium tetraurelia]|uniref:Uncharacterized protein n=1 Tax=Paramecium tetraurelia TaxID=5888 RepID=A0CIV8_PARTE|nr:uncharacterized protein GSPATT00007860001 [Paramecium tetraurelia]CAK70725.1 unnamed protein product [Paramecium tetraurelia]|eukprot:XP_001438122.1 hypothetical protein (macronuclear) [Paramecium tetraurelia strain d4-2]
MGCTSGAEIKQNSIIQMKTRNQDVVFTSTEDISKIYQFGKVLGVGSFGKVVTARMIKNLEKQYAIKIIERAKVKGREDVLANEIYMLQRLDHPNIIKFHEVYQNNQNFYICMDYCKGGELVEWIPKKYKSFHEQHIQGIMKKIASAVCYIHDQGIVHRDIKAENIMVTSKKEDGEPKLIDFGLANKFDTSHLKRLKSFAGTPMYMAPEVIKGSYDEKCDIWSLGVLLFTLLSGHLPFHGETKEELYDNIQTANISFDSAIWSHISGEAKDIIKRMLSKQPAQRLTSKELVKHNWFKKHFKNDEKNSSGLNNSLNSSVFENRSIYSLLKQNQGGAKFKKEVKTLLINQLNETELNSLKEIFKKIDVDNSGTITFQELKEALKAEGSPATYEDIEKLINNVAPPQTQEEVGKRKKEFIIKYSEFLASCIDERKFITKEKLSALFKIFDTDNSNFITKQNIKEAFARNGKQISDKQIDEMIAEIDPNHDNKISFEEFCLMFDNVGGVNKNFNEDGSMYA